MAKIVAVSASAKSFAHTHMAAEALKKTAELMGHSIVVESQGTESDKCLSAQDIQEAQLVIVAADDPLALARFDGKQIYATSSSEAIRNTQQILVNALALVGIKNDNKGLAVSAAASTATVEPSLPSENKSLIKKIVAITACPTGIAHTFMAAEALRKWAMSNGHEIHVETQGSVGAKNQLTDEQIANADVVVIGADTHVDESRFAGKAVYKTSVGRALKDTNNVMKEAFTVKAGDSSAVMAKSSASSSEAKAIKKPATGAYKHLLTGVSYMLPLVVAGGLLIALSFVFGIEAFKEPGTFAASLMQIGGGSAFALMIPILAGYIAFSIADRPGLTPGLIGGMLASSLGAGFLGGIIAGFLAGYVVKFLKDFIRLPVSLEGLMPVFILPLLSSFIVGLAMIYVIGGPCKYIMDSLTQFLTSMSGTNAVLLGLLLGGMMAVDMGGPVNKAAYTFSVGLLSSQSYLPMAATMAAGMIPPLALSLATFIAKNRFTADERTSGKVAFFLGLAFITEGAIPFAAKDPLRVLPCCIIGAAITGALSMYFGVQLHAPHGGIFAIAIPNAVSAVGPYLAAIVAGTIVSTVLLVIVKKPIIEKLA